jgi:hypothetical protein
VRSVKRFTAICVSTTTALALLIGQPSAVTASPDTDAARAAAGSDCTAGYAGPENGLLDSYGVPSDRARASSPRSVRATPTESTELVPETLVADLLEWIGARTDYDVSRALDRPPRVLFAEEGTRIAYEGRELDIGPTLSATYDAYSREIHLKCPWSAADRHDVSTLLHELVHDVQYYNRLWPCPRDAEWEAYHLQAAWLEEHGEQPEFNWLQAVLLSGCRGDVHP